MPVHDWTRVDAGTFHALHLAWAAQLSGSLNRGLLPSNYYALVEYHACAVVPNAPIVPVSAKGKRRTIAIRHVSGHRIVALVEILSPANKDRRRSVVEFVNKVVAALQLGIHLLLSDLFPPGRHDPSGMHGALWDRFDPDKPYELPTGQPLALASYAAAMPPTAFVNHLAVGDTLLPMPLFLTADRYVDVPLETTYRTAYAGMPLFWRNVIEGKQQTA